MFYKKSYNFFVLIFFIFSAVVFAQKNPQQNKKVQKIYMQYRQISQKLQSVQLQALADKKIKKKRDEFSKELQSEMIKENPSVKKEIAQENELRKEYKAAQAKDSKKKMTAIAQKYQGISQDLQTAQQKAIQNPKLLKEKTNFQQELLAKMTEIEPKTPQLMKELRSLSQELQQTRQQN